MTAARLLVCVDGSRPALAAARLALAMAEESGGAVRVVSVLEHGEADRRLDARGRLDRPAAARRTSDVRALLARVSSMGAQRGVPVETRVLEGDPLGAILRDARAWRPDLVLVGRTGRSGPGSPMIGSLAVHLVEFSEWPVVVVPDRPLP